MGEDCDGCAIPPGRGSNVVDTGEVQKIEKGKEKIDKGSKSKSIGAKRKVKKEPR
jgi:hypothetical protein